MIVRASVGSPLLSSCFRLDFEIVEVVVGHRLSTIVPSERTCRSCLFTFSDSLTSRRASTQFDSLSL
jgi:hypothetical protein